MDGHLEYESEFDRHFAYTNEFLIDSDEGSPLPDPADLSLSDVFPDTADAQQNCTSPSQALGLMGDSPQSMDSPYESMFDSGSSKGTASTASTNFTAGDSTINGRGKPSDWRNTGDVLGAGANDFLALNDMFDSAATLRSPTGTENPTPFRSALSSLSPEATVSSPPAGAASSFPTAREDSFPFTFKPQGSGMQLDVSGGAPTFPPATLSLRQLQPLPPHAKFEFHGSQEADPLSADMSGIFNPVHPGPNQIPAGPFFPNTPLHTPAQPGVDYHQSNHGPYNFDVIVPVRKSRVETQIPITLTLSHLPHGVTKLHLPRHTISKPKFWAKPPPDPSPDMLDLHTMLVCASAIEVPNYRKAALVRAEQAARLRGKHAGADAGTSSEEVKTQEGGEVRICKNCVGREAKRAGRKKSKNPEDEAAWKMEEGKRVIVFNTPEVQDWALQKHRGSGYQVEVPMRIACYCRHHSEKRGFEIILTLTDHLGQVVAQVLSGPVMITDDHKTSSPKPPLRRMRAAPGALLSPREELPPQTARESGPSSEPSPSLDQQAARRSSAGLVPVPAPEADQFQPALVDQHAMAISRPASPSFSSGPAKRRRGNKSVVKITNNPTLAPLDTNSFVPGPRMPSSAASGVVQPSATPSATSAFPPTPPSLFPPTRGDAETTLLSPGAVTPDASPNPFASNPQTGANNSQLLLPNLGNLAMPMFGLPGPTPPNTVSNPSAPQAASNSAGPPSTVGGQPRPQPSQTQTAIFKVIPGEGPVSGGIEVTLMGQGFDRGMQVMFGDKQAPGTMFWSSHSLVCLLPPAESAGIVPVTIEGLNVAPQWFRYVDDNEQQLVRTALMILGNKMTGRYPDVADFARRIIDEANRSYPSPGGDAHPATGSANLAMDKLEAHLLKLLELMDLSNSTQKPRLNLKRRSTRQTMLHLACKMGLHRFVAGLLARGANSDPRDKGGYTPLHMASMNNHPEIVRSLIAHGADPTLRTLSGLTATDLTSSRDVLQIIQDAKRYKRSQSGSLSHSRVSSGVSLKSLRAPAPLSQAVADASSEESRSEEEGSEDSVDASSSDVVDDESGSGEHIELRTRRSKSAANTPGRRRSPSRSQRRRTDATGALGLPSAAMAAIREQVAAQLQQLQQMMVPRFQQLPQFPQFPPLPQLPQFSQLPNFPQLPNMPPLPEYQNLVLQRIATMIGAARPGSAGEDVAGTAAAKDQQSGWQNTPSLPAWSSAPPPAYDELFPQQQQQQQDNADAKRTSAARAAVEAAADAKCAALFDQAEGSASATASSTSVASKTAAPAAAADEVSEDSQQGIPALLEIGRKDAITQEQQATLRRAHAQNMKRLSRDRNLFFIWIPLLVLMVGAMLYHHLPGLIAGLRDLGSFVSEPVGDSQREGGTFPVLGATWV